MKRIALFAIFLIFSSYQTSLFSQDNKSRRESVTMEEQAMSDMIVINNKLILTNAPVGKRVEVITIIGNKIREFLITSPNCEYELNLPRAIYIVRMDGTVRKFIIK